MYAFAANIGLGPGRRRGAQLLLSTPLATDFGPVPQGGGGGGAQLDGEFAFYASRSRLWAWLGVGGGGRAAGRGVCFYASRRQHWAWPGEGCGGLRCVGVEFAFHYHTHWPLDGRPSYSRYLVPRLRP